MRRILDVSIALVSALVADSRGDQKKEKRFLSIDDVRLITSKGEHEDHLTSQRMGWFLTLQGLLLTAFGLLLDEGFFPAAIVAGVGAISSLSTVAIIRRGVAALQALQARAAKRMDPGDPLTQVLQVGAETPAHRRRGWMYPYNLLPWVVLGTWVCLFAWLILR